jgi:hypothetical protein
MDRVYSSLAAGQGCLDGERYPLLCLQWRVARCFGVDLDLDIGDVRDGVDWQLAVVPDAQA